MSTSTLKKILGTVLLLAGIFAFLTPLTPGAWLIIVGAELLGLRLLVWERVRQALAARFFQSRQRAAVTLVVATLAVVLVGVASYWAWWQTVRSKSSPPEADIASALLPRAVARVGSTEVMVELARTPFDQARGLGGRTTLDPDAGMLFVFPTSVPRVFWMKDTQIPLDFLWIRAGTIVGITANVQPEPGVPDALLRRYASPSPVDHVLEVNAGWAERHGIRVGEAVQLTLRR